MVMMMMMNRALYTPPLQLQFCPFSSPTILLSLKPPTPIPLLPLPTQFHSLKRTKERVRLTQLTRVPMASSTPITEAETEAKQFSVLFVCLGNICRSPAAEGVFTGLVKSRGLDSKFKVDSAGTIGYHQGDQADRRMRAAAKNRGIQITSLSRPIQASDFRDFDLILAMDRQNKDDILGALERWKFMETLPADAHKKVRLMCSYCKKRDESEVPDPYYGGPQGFEKVLDLLEDACESLLDSILTEHNTIADS